MVQEMMTRPEAAMRLALPRKRPRRRVICDVHV
ncbi:hypothetical protein K788_00033265 [Paraburkholderia caribensis MBA4]|uniref:Uncharacterized protein n=1 Tax=Paraburkholderia caribensis MBA4 TaxID=1323664 RepID=A0A0P0R8E3_9BURK|nr:hypothetical protein K788_00033265 [Paraburkholderia caribensis MBA4]